MRELEKFMREEAPVETALKQRESDASSSDVKQESVSPHEPSFKQLAHLREAGKNFLSSSTCKKSKYRLIVRDVRPNWLRLSSISKKSKGKFSKVYYLAYYEHFSA